MEESNSSINSTQTKPRQLNSCRSSKYVDPQVKFAVSRCTSAASISSIRRHLQKVTSSTQSYSSGMSLPSISSGNSTYEHNKHNKPHTSSKESLLKQARALQKDAIQNSVEENSLLNTSIASTTSQNKNAKLKHIKKTLKRKENMSQNELQQSLVGAGPDSVDITDAAADWLTEALVTAVIRSFGPHASGGPDKIKPIIMQHFDNGTIKRLVHIYKASYLLGVCSTKKLVVSKSGIYTKA